MLKVVQTEYMHLTCRFHHLACALHPIPSFANDNTHVQLRILNIRTGQKHIEKRKHGHSAVDSYTYSDTSNTTSRMSLKMSTVFWVITQINKMFFFSPLICTDFYKKIAEKFASNPEKKTWLSSTEWTVGLCSEEFINRIELCCFFSIGHCEEALLVINPEIYTSSSSHTKWDQIQFKNLIHQTVMCCCACPCSILEKRLFRQNNVSVVAVVSISRKMEKTLQPQSLVGGFRGSWSMLSTSRSPQYNCFHSTTSVSVHQKMSLKTAQDIYLILCFKMTTFIPRLDEVNHRISSYSFL